MTIHPRDTNPCAGRDEPERASGPANGGTPSPSPRRLRRRSAAALLVALAMTAWDGARAASPARADPTDPEAAVPEAVHRAPFDGYRSHRSERVGSWRAVNDEVGRIGGWRSYAREAAAAPDAVPAPGATPAAQPVHPKH